MAGNCSEGLGDDFFEQILAVPSPYTNSTESAVGYGNGRTVADAGSMPMVLQLGSNTGDGGDGDDGSSRGGGGGFRGIGVGVPLGLNLEQGLLRHQDSRRFSDDVVEGSSSSNNHKHLHLNNNTNNNNSTTSSPSSSTAGINERDSMHVRGLFSAFGQLHAHTVRPMLPSPPPPAPLPAQPQLHYHQPFHGQPPTQVSIAAMPQPQPQPPAIRPRVRARRGQATDPHSIAERLRRERIAERMKALQELVPSVNKTDKAAMLDEIVDYVKFLRLQVKVLSMSRLGGAGAVTQLVTDVPLSTVEGEDTEGGVNQQAWEKWSNDGTEQQVAKLMEEDVGAAMQFLQSKALCIMPISLASAIFRMPQSEAPTLIKPESNSHT